MYYEQGKNYAGLAQVLCQILLKWKNSILLSNTNFCLCTVRSYRSCIHYIRSYKTPESSIVDLLQERSMTLISPIRVTITFVYLPLWGFIATYVMYA